MQNNKQVLYIKDLNIYDSVPEKEFCEIAPNSVDKNFDNGIQIYTPHEEDGNIYVIHRGEVILYHSLDGKKSVFDTLGPGDVFGVFDEKNLTPNHFAQSTKNTILCTTPINEFLDIVSAYPTVMLRMMKKMAIKIGDYEEKIKSNIETASEKVYSSLLQLQKKRSRNPFSKLIPLQMTHEKIAELTNLNRVTVTRCINKLKKEGLIIIDTKTGSIVLDEQL